MPAISFRKEFADAVESGKKRQKIRAPRRDGRPTATIGARLYLYTGMRTKVCRKLGEAICTRTAQFIINPNRQFIIDGTPILSGRAEDKFAQADGFKDAFEMTEWFLKVHGLPFEGSLIEWRNDDE